MLIALQQRFVRPEYFAADKPLFPRWPEVDPVLAKYVFIGTTAMLLAPKLLAYVALLLDGRLRRAAEPVDRDADRRTGRADCDADPIGGRRCDPGDHDTGWNIMLKLMLPMPYSSTASVFIATGLPGAGVSVKWQPHPW